ncbi:MAG: hypothetical protein KDK54_19230 [Leptospiraceae bacterium]|nr:hypothetical protein [Leptospiraceae bacterium]
MSSEKSDENLEKPKESGSGEVKFNMETGEAFQKKVGKVNKTLDSIKNILLFVVQSRAFKSTLNFLIPYFPNLENLNLKTLEEQITSVFVILTRIITVFMTTALIYASFTGIFDQSLVFEPIKMPEELVKIGFNPSEISSLIVEDIKLKKSLSQKGIDLVNNKSSSGSLKSRGNLEYDFEKSIAKEDIVIMGISLNSVKQLIRNSLGKKDSSVAGSIVQSPTSLQMYLRISNAKEFIHPIKVEIINGDTIEAVNEIISQAGLMVLKVNEPYIASLYLMVELQKYKSSDSPDAAKVTEKENELRDFILKSIERSKGKEYEKNLFALKGMINSQIFGDYAAANESFRKAEDMGLSGSSSFYLEWGYSLNDSESSEDKDLALEKFQKALSIDPKNVDVLSELAMEYLIRGDLDTSEEYLNKLEKLKSGNIYTRYIKAKLLDARGNSNEAIEILKTIVREHPNLIHVKMELAYLSNKQSLFDEASSLYEEILKLDPSNEEAKIGLDYSNKKTVIPTESAQ